MHKKFGYFNVKVLNKGDTYGLNGVRTHDEDEALVEFYDARQNTAVFGELGQFVARYYIDSVLEHEIGAGYGLALDRGIPEWHVQPNDMDSIVKWLRAL